MTVSIICSTAIQFMDMRLTNISFPNTRSISAGTDGLNLIVAGVVLTIFQRATI